MQPRALKNLSQMKFNERLRVIAEGLDALHDHVRELEKDAATLAAARRHQSAATLRAFADEEAAKIFILLDIVRLGMNDSEVLKSATSKFYDHLARGIYVRAYDGRPADLQEVRKYADYLRQSLHLDGPNEVDWAFRNDILSRREEQLYVDWVIDEHGEGRWVGPSHREQIEDSWSRFPPPASNAISLVLEMGRIDFFTPANLLNIDTAWGPLRENLNPHFQDIHPTIRDLVLNQLRRSGQQTSMNGGEALRIIGNDWIFPLLTLDMRAIEVSPDDLERQRAAWLASEGGF